MMIQAALGIASIWGNIVIYVTSKYRETDPNLSTQFTLIVFPATLAIGSIAMQLGAQMMDFIGPRTQTVLGGIIFSTSIYLAQFTTTFGAFISLYAVAAGVGFGIVYFLPLLCAWTYFPNKRNLVAGFILCAFSLNAIAMSRLTTYIVNPDNEKPDILVKIGKNQESFFSPNSYQVTQLDEMFNKLTIVSICLFTLSLPLLTKKESSGL